MTGGALLCKLPLLPQSQAAANCSACVAARGRGGGEAVCLPRAPARSERHQAPCAESQGCTLPLPLADHLPLPARPGLSPRYAGFAACAIPGYQFYPGAYSAQGSLGQLPGATWDANGRLAVATKCSSMATCKGFGDPGVLKKALRPLSQWSWDTGEAPDCWTHCLASPSCDLLQWRCRHAGVHAKGTRCGLARRSP